MCPRLNLTRCLQACTFKVDYTLENIPGREFGSVFLTDKNENLALAVVSSGWSKVGKHPTSQKMSWLLMLLMLGLWLRTALPLLLQIRSGGGQQSPYYAELETAQSNAESSGLGLWSKVQPCGSF